VSSEFSAQQYAMMARLVPGSQLAGYVLEEQVGAGGMAVVFRARDEMLGRLAALKVLSPALAADQEFRARFLRESQAVASVEERAAGQGGKLPLVSRSAVIATLVAAAALVLLFLLHGLG